MHACVLAFLQVCQCFLAVFRRWSSLVLSSLCIPMSIWLQFFPGDPSGGPPVLFAFLLRLLRPSTSTPVLVPMLGGSCTLPGASNIRFLRLSLMCRSLPLWLSGIIMQPHRTSWPARVLVFQWLWTTSFSTSVKGLYGVFTFRLFFIIFGSSSIYMIAAAADQYSGARSHAWWKLHASWC